MRSSILRSINVSTLLLLSFNNAIAAGPPLPRALADAPAVSAALNNTLEIAKTGSRTRWEAPSGRYGFITINRTWFPQPDQPCREYLRSLVNPSGKPTLMHGTGCRDANGKWMLLETQRAAASTSTSAASDCPPAPAVATPLPSTPARPAPVYRPAAASSKAETSTRAKTSDKTSTKVTSTPAKSASASGKTGSTTPEPKPTSTPTAATMPLDPAAAAVIDASRPTPAEW